MSSLKNIAVLFDESAQGLHVLETAARMAGQQAGHLIGITAMDQGPTSIHDGYAIGSAVAEVLALRQSAMASRVLASGQRLNSAVQRHAGSGELRIISFTESGSESALHALSCDLLVLSSPELLGTPRTWMPETILRRSGVPILIVPRVWADKPIARRIVVAWNGSRQSRRAIADALPLLTSAEVVKVLVVDPETGSELLGSSPGADMAAFLARHHVAVDVALNSSNGAPIADAIQTYAASVDADLLVIGAYSHSRVVESLVGGVTRTMFGGVNLPLFVSQ